MHRLDAAGLGALTLGAWKYRSVVVQDLQLLRAWHSRPHVLEWWPDPPSDEDLADYCAVGTDRASRFYIALLDGAPAGFIQSYRPVDGHAEGWWLDEHDPGVRGIDQFLAHAEQLNLGLGTQMIRDFVSMLWQDPAVTRIQVDPKPTNSRAIRCYEKVGFRAAREVITPDGSALLLYLDRHPPAEAPVPAGRVLSVQIGRVAPLGPENVPSAFVKQPIAGPVHVEPLGLDGDEQADLRVHGGPGKAVYGYAHSNYAHWLQAFPQHAALLVPGGLGENLTLDDCNEQSVHIGDIVRIGSTVLQVTEPRQPCFKFALRFGDELMVRAMVKNGLCGWYYRVLEPGTLAAGDAVSLLARPNPTWPVDRVNRRIVQRRASAAEREEFASVASRSASASALMRPGSSTHTG